MLTFGPVPSRRLGRSLGINHLPAKTCCYACAYCQVGATTCHSARRERFHPPAELARQHADTAVLERLLAAGQLVVRTYQGTRFYQRPPPQPRRPCHEDH